MIIQCEPCSDLGPQRLVDTRWQVAGEMIGGRNHKHNNIVVFNICQDGHEARRYARRGLRLFLKCEIDCIRIAEEALLNSREVYQAAIIAQDTR